MNLDVKKVDVILEDARDVALDGLDARFFCVILRLVRRRNRLAHLDPKCFREALGNLRHSYPPTGPFTLLHRLQQSCLVFEATSVAEPAIG